MGVRSIWKRKLKRYFAYLTILPKAGSADWYPQKGKTKSHTFTKKKRQVCCTKRLELTKEKKKVKRTGIHMFGHSSQLGKPTLRRAGMC